ncbi:RB1-inducible coiled-coil protein 1-like [Amphiura filiformis]|uniref:RB1-inducible coiled-coil protein 1-like n=1 Tax=Amphiura filiformis TaxID=82378 RepID=UPI003B2258BE
MLYVFQVNTGTMLTLDMALTMESVQRLQESIEIEYQIPVDKQVLLISGGQSLDPQMRVCSYSAGTDTNPIFLFSKGTIESATPPITSSISQGKEENLKFQVEGLKNLPHSYSAVVSRTQLALQFHDLAKEKLKSCEALVLDQHQQQQGWMAVVANLEDITSAFEQRSRVFQQNMTEFLKERPDLVERLTQFSDILQLLEKTPLLPCLMGEGVMCMGDGDGTENDSLDSGMTLMKWISSQDQRSTLQQMALQCSKALDQFSQQVLDTIAADMTTTMESVNNPSMKEVKGLGDRLFGLEQLLVGAKKYLQEQAEMAQGMVQNQTRASNINDDSVLPDLCKSHQQQLTVMYKKHCQLTEISRRCQAAKEELCQNLHVRLRWIMYVEQQISGVHGKMVVYHENLKRLRKRLEIVRQVCAAPELYANAVVEVYRRKIFGSRFHEWAGQVSGTSISSHQEEVARRKEFASSMDRHFLNALFPGLGEFPPMFATQIPSLFDTKLPDITMNDIELLRRQIPELATSLEVPPVEEFVISKDDSEDKNWIDIETQTHSLVMVAKEMGDTDIVVIERDGQKDVRKEKISLETSSIEVLPLTENGLVVTNIDDLNDDDPDTPTSLTAETPTRLEGSGSSPSRPDELIMKSFEPKQLESFVSAPTTPDSIADMEMSARGETPFASLLAGGVPSGVTSPASVGGASFVSGPDGYFYSAVTSPASERFAFASNPASYRSSPISVDHVTLEELDKLKLTLQETELKVVKLEESSKSIVDEMLAKDQALQKAQDEAQRTSSELEKSQGLVLDLGKCLKCELPKLKEKCVELQNTVGLEKDNFSGGLKALMGDYQRISEIVQSCLTEEKQIIIKETVDTLKADHVKEIDALKLQLQEVSRSLDETNIELGQNQEALKLKAIEVDMIRENSAKEVNEIKTKMESEQEEAISALRMELAMELSDLETDNQDKTKQLEDLKSSTDAELKELQGRLVTEKSEAVDEIKKEWEEKHKLEMDALEKRLQETQLSELSEFQKTHQLKVDAACEELRTTMEDEQTTEANALRTEIEKLQETLSQLKVEQQADIAKLTDEHKVEVDNLKEDIVAMKTEHKKAMEEQSLKVSQMEVSFITEKQSSTLAQIEEERRQHKEEMNRLREELDRERNIAVADALGAANEVHAQEMEEVMKRSTDSSSGLLDNRNTVVETAERQVSFNEAINRVASEKDKQIEMLKTKEARLVAEQNRNKDTIEKLLTDKVDLDSEMSSALHESRDAEKEAKALLEEKEKEIEDLQQRLDEIQRKQDSPAELPVAADSDSKALDPTSQDKLRVLLRAKEQECNTLKQQLVQLRSITSHGGKSEKISIMDISSGDLVLIFFEEPRENYVVFSVEPTLYFVHSESLTALGLKQHGSSGPKRQWIIGRVTDKEYCQAKKAQNRFKVAMGTKFYRVKAVRYDLKQEQAEKK